MASITIYMGALEYFSGSDTYQLPHGINEEMIDNVQPDGYGEALIFLTWDANPVIDALDLAFTPESYRGNLDSAVLGDWLVYKFTNQYALKWRGEMHMDWCEVEENLVNDWEVNND